MAVASAVLTGLADTGLAVYSSAKALDLDFIPVAEERYDIAIPAEFMDTEKIKILLRIIREDKEFMAPLIHLADTIRKIWGKYFTKVEPLAFPVKIILEKPSDLDKKADRERVLDYLSQTMDAELPIDVTLTSSGNSLLSSGRATMPSSS